MAHNEATSTAIETRCNGDEHAQIQPSRSPRMHTEAIDSDTLPQSPYHSPPNGSTVQAINYSPASYSLDKMENTAAPRPLRRSARINSNQHAALIPASGQDSHHRPSSYPRTPPPHPSFRIRRTINKSPLKSGSPLSLSPTSSLSAGASSTSSPVSTRKRRSRRGTSWTIAEDNKLRELVTAEARAPPSIAVSKTWSKIASQLPGRSGKQCRERWLNQLQPGIKKEAWNDEEERILHEAHGRLGNHWVAIAKLLEGRTDNCVKNHWNSMLRKRQRREKAARRSAGKGGSGVWSGDVVMVSRGVGNGGGEGVHGSSSGFLTTAVGSPTSGSGVVGSPSGGRVHGGVMSGVMRDDVIREDMMRRSLTPALVALATAASSVPPSPCAMTDFRRSGSSSPLPMENGKVARSGQEGASIGY